MEPTLAIGQRVLVNRIDMDFSEPHVGEIAVFHPPEGAEQQVCGPMATRSGSAAKRARSRFPTEASVNFIKRIVAGPGDEIYVREGHVYRKAAGTSRFVRERDPYIKACGASSECNFTHADQDPRGALVHDGRQPRRLRRQPILGPGPDRLDHRPGDPHLLAPGPDRDFLAAVSNPLTRWSACG